MIDVGDCVRTSYGSGPYIVDEVNVDERDRISLVCHGEDGRQAWLNMLEETDEQDVYLAPWCYTGVGEWERKPDRADEVYVVERGKGQFSGEQMQFSFGGNSHR